jgi:hypothetical protein
MHIRHIGLVALFALMAAACGQPDTVPTPSTTPEPEVEAVLLSYTLEPGTTFEYEVDIDQDIELTTSGDTSQLGEEDMPGEAQINLTGTTTFTHSVADGPEPGTYAVTITGEFSDLAFSGTVDGESVEQSDIPEMAQMEPVEMTVIVDEQGNIIPESNPGLGEDFLGQFGGLDMLGQMGSVNPGQFVGPPLTEDEVTVGDTWSETIETPTMPDADPVTTLIESEVVGAETLEGNEVFVIQTTTTTSPIEFDLAELLIGFMTAFVPEETTPEEQAELDAIIEQLKFAFSVDESVGELTTWFDHDEGVARQADLANTTHMVMDVAIPDEATGEMVAFGVDMTIGQSISYRLVGTEPA